MRIGPYTIERELGRGGMGTVYLARAGQEPPVALKVIHPQLALDHDLAARFQAEGDALARLAHPNLVGLRGRGSSPQGPWLAMDYVEGQTLDERLKATGPLSNLEARELLLSLCGALAFAHAAGVLHRDLKPENVLLRAADGVPLVLDFGLALPTDVSQHLTNTGEILGSPGYLAPEQCGAKGETSAKTDVYGLGAVLYAALTGRPPFRESTLVATLDAALNTAPRDPREWVPSVAPALAETCLRCLAKDPNERYPGVAELMDALEAGGSPARSGPGVAGAAGTVLVLVLGLGGAWWWLGRGASQEGRPGQPSPTPSASLAATPGGADSPQVVAGALVEARTALSSKDWAGVHAALGEAEGAEALWLSYLALSHELRAKGEAGPGWTSQRAAALARARRAAEAAEEGEGRVWLEALRAMLEAIRYPFAIDLTPLEAWEGRVARLEAARQIKSLSDDQRRELARSLAQAEVKRVVDGVSLARAEAALERWRRLGGDPWTVELAVVDLHMMRGRFAEASRALDRADLVADRARPWQLLVGHYLREVLTQSPTEAPPPAQLRLSQHILSSGAAPELLRARVAAAYARSLVQAGRWQEALIALETHAPSGVDPRLRASHQEAKAYALLRGGDPRGARELFRGGEEELRSPWGRTILAIIQLRLGESERGNAALRGLVRALQDPEGQLLLLEAAVLAGDEGRWRRLLEGLTRGDDRVSDLRAQRALERALRARGPGGASVAPAAGPVREAVAGLRARSLQDPAALVAALLADGRWRRALRWIQEELGEGAVKPRPQLALRLSFRALERGRQEESVPSPRWHELRRVATRFGERALGTSPAERGLLALLELTGDPPPERLGELEAILAAALEAESWEELHEGYLRALTLRLVLGGAPSAVLQRETAAAVTAWAQKHQSPLAVYTHLQHVANPRRDEVLLSLTRQQRDRSVALLAQRDRVLAAVRSQQIAPRDGAERLSFLATDRSVLAAQRRDILLHAVELWLMLPGFGDEALACLERIEPWCGPAPQSHVRRLELARSKACAELPGREREAIAAAERALAAGAQTPEGRAPVLAHLGRLECQFGQRELGLEHLREALALQPGPEVWLDLARVLEGQEQRSAYLQVLGFPAPPGSAPHLLREIAAAEHDPVALSAEALRLLEARGQALSAMSLARAAADLGRTPASAHLVCQAYLAASMMTPDTLPELRPFNGLLDESIPRLDSRARALVEATLRLLAVRAQAQTGGQSRPERSQQAAAISAALARVDAAAEASPQDAAAFRYRLAQLLAYQHLAALAPGSAERAREQARARATLEGWVGEPGSDLRVPSWLAQLQSQDGDYAAALATLEGGLAKASEFPAQTGRLELARAIVLTHLDRSPEALEALERSRLAGGPLVEGPDSLSLRAEVQLSAGELEAAGQTLAQARAMSVAIQPGAAFGLSLLETRLLIERGQLQEAQGKLEGLGGSAQGPGVSARGLAQFETLRADLARRRGDLGAARRSLERALELAPRATGARLVEVDLVVAERGREAGQRRAAELAGEEGFSPYAQRRLRERARDLAKGD